MKKIISITILSLLIGFSFYSIYFFFSEKDSYIENKCGVIESKAEQLSGGKYGHTELFLNIRWDDGTGECKRVGNNVYYFHKKGDRVCFKEEKDMPFKDGVLYLFGVLFAWFYTLCVVVGIVFGFIYLINWCIKNIFN